jgi:hypothetical protein
MSTDRMPIVGDMEDGMAIVPLNGGEGYTYLSRSRQGKLFKKHILTKGKLLYPGVGTGEVELDDDFFAKLTKNFNDKVCDIVQVPKAGNNNEHTEDPDRNIGEVIGLEYEGDKLYATIDARNEADADKLGKTLLGASAMMHMNYTDTRTGKKVGPTLLHVAVTNRPYVLNLDDYQEIQDVVAASADGKGEAVVLTSATSNSKEKKMSTLDELLAELRTDHGIDVTALQEKAAKADEGINLSNKISETLGATGILKLSNGETASVDDIVEAVAEIHTNNVELSAKVDKLTEDGSKAAAKNRVKELMDAGKILPKDEEAQIELLLSNADLFEKLLPEKPIVNLSQNAQPFGFEDTADKHDETVASEIARLANSDAAAPYIRSQSK